MERRLIPVKLDSYKPLREIVFESLREAIINGTLKPGERLMEIQLAEEMGVSRTPVREAIRKLELEGFVVMVPRKGAYVAGISLKDIADVFEVRAALESLAAGLAAERITEEELEALERSLVKVAESTEADDLTSLISADTDFHDILYRASRNERLVQIVSNLREQIQRFRMTSLSHPGRMRVALEEHRKIVEAISERNVELAQQLAREHIENAENTMLNMMRKMEEEGAKG
ncbi:MAG: GntR family transcriptional regulator [Bacillota bacterium]|uniref:Transcriptional regulator, GntR family n=2 Tax=Carboxydocella TaxID=178898 RepID=A0A1T4QJN6_9FIRM|nr:MULTISPECIES: GntR family transcriptional regulator [Carboxydocella]AVX19262.1 transcriptional regulator, GntR family [Carboxydocella thermautotrophica]AVX29675.1 transcriptional regulator, GntR family [Carboxydocella thermautotrophica]SKA03711.1 transcriptional regulator, GntR family [Carboxydocella sporoproducens DSM 16521]GAW29861.1 GntR family transcriptional regulator [Carboxydocella sp. ULO1]GAW32882.1 GntR family transcriptional regulator [Carboxydocella sp. JDF658]